MTDDSNRSLEAVDASSFPLWFGTGFHFGMEDLHGYRRFSSPVEAFIAYAGCFSRNSLPDNATEGVELAKGMFDYYLEWRIKHPEFETLWIDGEPQVEVIFVLDLPTWDHSTGKIICEGFTVSENSSSAQMLALAASEDVYCEACGRPERQHNTYAGRFDRVATDVHDRWWVEDYKTAQRFDIQKLPTDPQVTSYTWAAQKMYGKIFEGVAYSQFLKEVPHPPARLQNGGFSQNKKQATTYQAYLNALIGEYQVDTTVEGASNQRLVGVKPGIFLPEWVINNYGPTLKSFKDQETTEGDRFIRRDLVRRNQAQTDNEYRKILVETKEMTNPDLDIYPNPTKDCPWDCSVRQVCISMDDGSDWQQLIDLGYRERTNVWRDRLIWPRDRLGLGQESDGQVWQITPIHNQS